MRRRVEETVEDGGGERAEKKAAGESGGQEFEAEVFRKQIIEAVAGGGSEEATGERTEERGEGPEEGAAGAGEKAKLQGACEHTREDAGGVRIGGKESAGGAKGESGKPGEGGGDEPPRRGWDASAENEPLR